MSDKHKKNASKDRKNHKYVSPISDQQMEEMAKVEEFWSDPCWAEPLDEFTK